jgi:hypothetical protein
MIWCTALGVRWDILSVCVEIVKGWRCCRKSKVGPMETKLIFSQGKVGRIVPHFIQCKKVVKLWDSGLGTSMRKMNKNPYNTDLKTYQDQREALYTAGHLYGRH